MHSDGYNPDYWMASFALYSSLIYCTNVVLLIRANQITWLLTLAYVGAASLMPFFVLVFLFDTVLEVQNAGSRSYLNLCQTWHYYFFCLSVIMACSFIEISKKMYRMFWKPYLNDYFKYLIHRGEQDNPENFKPEILEAFVKIHDPIQRTDLMRSKTQKKISHDLKLLSLELDDISVDSKGVEDNLNMAQQKSLKNESSINKFESSITGPTTHSKHTGRSSVNDHSESVKDKQEEHDNKQSLIKSSDSLQDARAIQLPLSRDMSHLELARPEPLHLAGLEGITEQMDEQSPIMPRKSLAEPGQAVNIVKPMQGNYIDSPMPKEYSKHV